MEKVFRCSGVLTKREYWRGKDEDDQGKNERKNKVARPTPIIVPHIKQEIVPTVPVPLVPISTVPGLIVLTIAAQRDVMEEWVKGLRDLHLRRSKHSIRMKRRRYKL